VIVSDIDEGTISDFNRRNTSTASCGVCGKESISNLLHIHGPELSKNLTIESSIIASSIDQLRSQQKLFHDTGGTHACGLFDINGNLLFIGEDIGRHNAMDKLVGNVLSKSNEIFIESFIIFSGRLSFELVHKARRAGISILVSIGAPSSLAIDIAVEHGLTIVGFAKNNSMTVYTGRTRIINS
jgi:FdhD protein